MDDHLLIDDIARQLDVAVETIRSYGERFAFFVPVVRTGAVLRYPPAGVTLLGEIHQAVEAGASFAEIEVALRDHLPVTIVAAPDTWRDESAPSPAVDEIRQLIVEHQTTTAEQIAGLCRAIDRLATADQFHGLRAETASLAAALALRDVQLDHANAIFVAELRAAFAALKLEIAGLRVVDLNEDEADESVDESPPIEAIPDRTPEQARSSRTLRRMGQPLRANGLPQN
jgi:DNA-binding transcriptional MerR regulator